MRPRLAATDGDELSCQQVVEIITDYLEGALEPRERLVVGEHLALCPGCQVYLEQMRSTVRTLGYVPIDTLSEQAQADLMLAFRRFRRPVGDDR
jgi:anti-sigma factor RsiW